MNKIKNCELDGHKCIVLCGDHYNPLGIVRSLGERGINAIVILIGKKPFILPASKYPLIIHYATSNEEGFHILMSKYGNEINKPFVFTGSDDTTAILDIHYNEIIDKFYFYNAGVSGRINFLMTKEEQYAIAERSGFNVAKSEVVKVGNLPTKVHYPVMTKSVNSLELNWKNNVHVCNNDKELLDAYKNIKGNEVILQEYIHKKTEMTFEGISVNHGKEVLLPMKTIYYRCPYNEYGLYYHFEKFDDEKLRKKIYRFIEEEGFDGIFEMEFLVTEDNKLYFLELNMRNSTWSYSSTCAGYNLPYTWAKSTLSGKLRKDLIDIKKLPHSSIVETQEFFGNVLKGKLSLLEFIKDLKNCDSYIFWNKADNGPFWALIRHKIKRGFQKTRNKICR